MLTVETPVFSNDLSSVVHLMASFFWNWKVINILFHAVNLPNQLLRFSLDVAVAFFLS